MVPSHSQFRLACHYYYGTLHQDHQDSAHEHQDHQGHDWASRSSSISCWHLIFNGECNNPDKLVCFVSEYEEQRRISDANPAYNWWYNSNWILLAICEFTFHEIHLGASVMESYFYSSKGLRLCPIWKSIKSQYYAYEKENTKVLDNAIYLNMAVNNQNNAKILQCQT